MDKKKIFVVTIEGPTSIGKSNLAMQLASHLKTDIISSDSRQVYRLLNIGTAKPSHEDQLKVHHHLIDIVDPDEEYNAGQFRNDAFDLCTKLNNEDKIPIIVGGTGFYLNSLLKGIASIPKTPESIKTEVAEDLEKMGNQAFHKYLESIDSVAAAKINYQDSHRILRAVEVFKSTGKPISEFWAAQNLDNDIIPFKILITEDRSILYDRINKRVDTMIEIGLIQEIKDILERGFNETSPGMITVGYREFYPYLKGEMSLEKAVQLVKQHTRNYAKRQLTWYRKQDFNLTINRNSISFSEIKDKIKNYKIRI